MRPNSTKKEKDGKGQGKVDAGTEKSFLLADFVFRLVQVVVMSHGI